MRAPKKLSSKSPTNRGRKFPHPMAYKVYNLTGAVQGSISEKTWWFQTLWGIEYVTWGLVSKLEVFMAHSDFIGIFLPNRYCMPNCLKPPCFLQYRALHSPSQSVYLLLYRVNSVWARYWMQIFSTPIGRWLGTRFLGTLTQLSSRGYKNWKKNFKVNPYSNAKLPKMWLDFCWTPTVSQ